MKRQESAEMLALQALGWLAAQDDEFCQCFLNASGASVGRSGRRCAPDREFLASVLDFLLMDDAWIIAFCDAHGLPYTAAACRRGRSCRAARRCTGPDRRHARLHSRPEAATLRRRSREQAKGERMIDGVIFDKDGTLFDFRKAGAAGPAVAARSGADDGSRASRMADSLGFDPATGHSTADSPVIAATQPRSPTTCCRICPGSALAALVDADEPAGRCRPQMSEAVPLRPLLTALRARGLRLGVATNDIEAAARRILRRRRDRTVRLHRGLRFRAWRKAGPGHVLAFAAATGLEPGRVLMVGDSRHDLDGRSRRRNAHRRGADRDRAAPTTCAPLAEVVLPDIGALPRWIDAQLAGSEPTRRSQPAKNDAFASVTRCPSPGAHRSIFSAGTMPGTEGEPR